MVYHPPPPSVSVCVWEEGGIIPHITPQGASHFYSNTIAGDNYPLRDNNHVITWRILHSVMRWWRHRPLPYKDINQMVIYWE